MRGCRTEAVWSPGGGGRQRPLQIPQVYYSRKAGRRDGGGQDVTGSSIDWLRRKIGERGPDRCARSLDGVDRQRWRGEAEGDGL